MAEETKPNKVHEISSTSNNGEVDKEMEPFLLERSKHLKGRVYLVVYKHHEVVFGEVKDGALILERKEELTPEYLKELRMFSFNGELYTWNRGGSFKYRMRIDTPDDKGEQHVYDERHYMWGDRVDKHDEFTAVEPNRGMRLTFPFKVNSKALPLMYGVRNYLKYDEETGLIRFYDARFVEFLDAGGKELEND